MGGSKRHWSGWRRQVRRFCEGFFWLRCLDFLELLKALGVVEYILHCVRLRDLLGFEAFGWLCWVWSGLCQISGVLSE